MYFCRGNRAPIRKQLQTLTSCSRLRRKGLFAPFFSSGWHPAELHGEGRTCRLDKAQGTTWPTRAGPKKRSLGRGKGSSAKRVLRRSHEYGIVRKTFRSFQLAHFPDPSIAHHGHKLTSAVPKQDRTEGEWASAWAQTLLGNDTVPEH